MNNFWRFRRTSNFSWKKKFDKLPLLCRDFVLLLRFMKIYTCLFAKFPFFVHTQLLYFHYGHSAKTTLSFQKRSRKTENHVINLSSPSHIKRN